MLTLTIKGKNAAEIRLELKRLLAETATMKRDFNPTVTAPTDAVEAVEAVEAVKAEAVEAEKTKADPAPTPEEKPVTITEVRQALKDTADAFGLEAAQEILHKYAPKLADLNADKYAALLAELQEKLG